MALGFLVGRVRPRKHTCISVLPSFIKLNIPWTHQVGRSFHDRHHYRCSMVNGHYSDFFDVPISVWLPVGFIASVIAAECIWRFILQFSCRSFIMSSIPDCRDHLLWLLMSVSGYPAVGLPPYSYELPRPVDWGFRFHQQASFSTRNVHDHMRRNTRQVVQQSYHRPQCLHCPRVRSHLCRIVCATLRPVSERHRNGLTVEMKPKRVNSGL